jgi:hypothetical protein
MHINDIHNFTHIRHSEGFLEGAKPFLIHLGSKLTYIPVRPYALTFLFYPFLLFNYIFFLLFSSYSYILIFKLLVFSISILIFLFSLIFTCSSLLIFLVLYSSSSYSSLLIFKLFVLQTCILNTHWAELHK